MDKYKIRIFINNLLRGRLLSFYRIFNKNVTDIIEGTTILYDPNTDIGSKLFFTGEFEKSELEFCKKYINEDSIVLDIGANIGIHSIYYSKIATKGLVFSFEPSPETFFFLLHNTQKSSNIIPLNIGVAESNKLSEFYIASDNAYSSLKNTRRKDIKNKIKIFCCKLDDFFLGLNLPRLDFIKIDVEGCEHDVLEGMQQIISKYHPIIFCEIYQGINSNEYPENTIEFLIKKGYRAFVFDGNQLLPYEKHNDILYNYLFLP